MDISPQRVRTAEFKTVKRGLDPEEVRDFLADVAAELERAQNQSTAMEARARAAVARLQELSGGAPATPVATSEPAASESTTTGQAPASTAASMSASVTPSVDEAETISRTLLLAQRTADMTVAEAKAEAERISREAGEEASRTLDSTREMSSRLVDEAREEARREGDNERKAVRTEVESLKARRDFLESDVDHLERHLADERSRLREAATSLLDLTERVPGGMGEVRRPLLSASDDADDEAAAELDAETGLDDATPIEAPAPDPGADDSDALFIQTELDRTTKGGDAGPDADDAELLDFDD